MTLDCSSSFVYVVNVRICMRLAVLQSNFRGYSCINTMTEKWKNLKAATTVQILSVYFKHILLREKSQLYCELLENITFCV